MLKICFFEDSSFENFFPLTYFRPVYLLQTGVVPLYRKAEQFFSGVTFTFVVRNQLAPIISQQYPEIPVSIIKREENTDVLFLNGRIRAYGDLPKLVRDSRLSTVFKNGNDTIGVLFKIDTLKEVPKLSMHDAYIQMYEKHKDEIPDFPTTASLYHYSWDLVNDIEESVTSDIRFLNSQQKDVRPSRVHDGASLLNPSEIFLDGSVEVLPGAVIDATKGPVSIGANTRIEAHSAIYGPSAVGPNSVVVAGKISQCSIGHTCRVGGEIEESIFLPYVNKYHAGFIGHSVVGSWVNFGAMTTNSDLKNTYATIHVVVNGRRIDTGSIKVGSFIGDHTKFGIGTLLNTGINVGACCNIFGGGLTTDREIPSFSWGNTGNFKTYAFDRALEAIKHSTERRGVVVSEHEEVVLKDLFERKISPDGVLSL
jgi:UDP-N-acetylglucosamine diphosphorylase / glucose-1-phosphate thymidylyltransferase / UDP-N-acetylgalactosamine diphosphorylase / glucosamine-1-phosphate N-acetyltransferase / galactosamine-1-phosphate N-acetyltransferase